VLSPFATAGALYVVRIIGLYTLSKDSDVSILIYIVVISSINYVSLRNAWGPPTNGFVVFSKQQVIPIERNLLQYKQTIPRSVIVTFIF